MPVLPLDDARAPSGCHGAQTPSRCELLPWRHTAKCDGSGSRRVKTPAQGPMFRPPAPSNRPERMDPGILHAAGSWVSRAEPSARDRSWPIGRIAARTNQVSRCNAAMLGLADARPVGLATAVPDAARQRRWAEDVDVRRSLKTMGRTLPHASAMQSRAFIPRCDPGCSSSAPSHAGRSHS